MNNPQAVDWSGLKAAAIALQSVNEAARRASINLPPAEAERFRNRVNKRAYRERWIDQNTTLAETAIVRNARPLSKNVQTGSDTLLSKLKEHGDSTKINLAKVAKTASEALLKKKGNALLKQHQAFKNFVSGSGQLHGWDTASSGGSINLNILTNQAAVQVNAGAAK